jgi:hypothetical protein
MEKHSSLLRKFVNYGGKKKFYNIDPRSSSEETPEAELKRKKSSFKGKPPR